MHRDNLRYTPRCSLRSFRGWLIHAWICDTPSAGPCIGFRFCGWEASIYPWHKKEPRQ